MFIKCLTWNEHVDKVNIEEEKRPETTLIYMNLFEKMVLEQSK